MKNYYTPVEKSSIVEHEAGPGAKPTRQTVELLERLVAEQLKPLGFSAGVILVTGRGTEADICMANVSFGSVRDQLQALTTAVRTAVDRIYRVDPGLAAELWGNVLGDILTFDPRDPEANQARPGEGRPA